MSYYMYQINHGFIKSTYPFYSDATMILFIIIMYSYNYSVLTCGIRCRTASLIKADAPMATMKA